MTRIYILCFVAICLLGTNVASAQNLFVRIAANTGSFSNEIGTADVPHPFVAIYQPELVTEDFTADSHLGFEAELLFPLSSKMMLGAELESLKLSGYNDSPPVYNFYFTAYNPLSSFTLAPIAFETSLVSALLNLKYYFVDGTPVKPFVKITGGVAFIATEFTFKNVEDAGFETNIFYARGTSNSDRSRWPAAYSGVGFGLDFQVSSNLAVQVDAGSSIIFSDIIDGVPNFSYENVDEVETLEHRTRPSMNFQFSAGLVYSLESIQLGSKGSSKSGKKRGKSGRTDPYLPFSGVR